MPEKEGLFGLRPKEMMGQVEAKRFKRRTGQIMAFPRATLVDWDFGRVWFCDLVDGIKMDIGTCSHPAFNLGVRGRAVEML